MDIEKEIGERGLAYWDRIQSETPGIFDTEFWQGKMLEWVMKDPSFKTDMFRFVDVFPVLENTADISQHIREYLLKPDRELPELLNATLKAASRGLTAGIAATVIRKQVTSMAERFIVGQDASRALRVLKQLHKKGVGFTADLLGEAVFSKSESDAYKTRYLDLIQNLSETVDGWSANAVLDNNHTGPIPRTNISLKVSAFAPFLDPVDTAGSVSRLKQRIRPVLLEAKERNVFINFDMEQWDLHEITMQLFREMALDPEFRDWPHMGIVIQAYLVDAEDDLDFLLRLVQERGTPVTVRLVKGAYWDYEVVMARQHGHRCPVFTDKGATDLNYERLSLRLLKNVDVIQTAFGSHNLRSLIHAMVQAENLGLDKHAFEIQMLYGMAEPERKCFVHDGYRVRVYAPVGEMIPGMAYLVRRLLENSSNQGFLRLSFHDHRDIREMLQKPESAENKSEISPAFINNPLLDFRHASHRERFQAAIQYWDKQLPLHVPIVINGQPFEGTLYERESPNQKDRSVARVQFASENQLEEAIGAALKSWPSWRDSPLSERIHCLEKLADELAANRNQLAALQCWEVAKPWAEADADIAEAIDFCRYYAQRAPEELGSQENHDYTGELNTYMYEGRGPTAVIAPWNFPVAILCGMCAAALVAGNTIIMKPAEQSSACAYELFKAMEASGFPPDVIQFLPGDGETIGAKLVAHPVIANIAFTGSRSVGESILKEAGTTRETQSQVKRVICEMGGKNATIVDADADSDEAVAGVIGAAFGYAGQKCSATSRVLVVGNAINRFIPRLKDVCESLETAAACDPSCMIPPLIDQEAFDRVRKQLDAFEKTATSIYRGKIDEKGYYLGPMVFQVDDPMHPLMQDEFLPRF